MQDTYIGQVEVYDNFHNIRPVAIITNGEVKELSIDDINERFPKSKKKNIYYDTSGMTQESIDLVLQKDTLVIIDIDPNTLPLYFRNPKTHDLYDTGYRLSALEELASRRLRTLSEAGIYYALRFDKTQKEDFFYGDAVSFKQSYSFDLTGKDCVISIGDGLWAGPYIIKGDNSDTYSVEGIKQHSYVIHEITYEKLAFGKINSRNYQCEPVLLAIPKDDASWEWRDMMTDEILISNFKRALSTERQLDANEFDAFFEILKQDINSPIVGTDVPAEIRRERINKLYSLAQDSGSMQALIENLGGSLSKYIFADLDERKRDDILLAMVEKNPSLISHILPKDEKRLSSLGHRADQLSKTLFNDQRKNPLTEDQRIQLGKIVRNIQEVRPEYTPEEILNPIICLAQGFLTVFTGPPGCGKTSMSRIIASVLGLRSKVEEQNRYIEVPVQKGWASPEDFLGYYNALKSEFVPRDPKLSHAIQKLDSEGNEFQGSPFLILLDEANLSQMEYYWSEFMNASDELAKMKLLIGPNEMTIPEHLRFIATINNDETTMPLSPRLIDRSWIVTLPLSPWSSARERQLENNRLPCDISQRILWQDLQKLLIPVANDVTGTFDEFDDVYTEIQSAMETLNISFSYRTHNAMRQYYSAASRVFELYDNTDGKGARSKAFDFAVVQRLLPKLQTSSPKTKDVLKGLKEFLEGKQECKEKIELPRIIKQINEISERGEILGFYSYF